MKTVPLLRVEAGVGVWAEIFAAAAARGMRLGWLEWDPGASAQPTPPLLDAAMAGAARAVRVEALSTTAVVQRRGAAQLGDVVRGHFLGCDAVLILVTGTEPIEAPLLRASPTGWVVEVGDEEPRSYTTQTLLDAVRRPSVVRHRWQQGTENE